MTTDQDARSLIIDHCLALNAKGLNRGTSGNISQRVDGGFVVTPTARPYETLTPACLTFMDLDGQWRGPYPPSSEWRFHRDIYVARPDTHAVVHAHPTFATSLAIHSRDIPAIHYMIAIFGGNSVRTAPYALYGTQALSEHVLRALEDRTGCLLAHHGAITIGSSLPQAFWRMEELEGLAQVYLNAATLGTPPLLSDAQIEAVLAKIGGYGRGDDT